MFFYALHIDQHAHMYNTTFLKEVQVFANDKLFIWFREIVRLLSLFGTKMSTYLKTSLLEIKTFIHLDNKLNAVHNRWSSEMFTFWELRFDDFWAILT